MSKKLKLTPIADRLFIDYPDVALPNEVGGIILPPDFDPNKGTIIYVEAKVIATGPDCKWVESGDTILVAKNQTERITHDGNLYFLINEKAVCGVVENPK